MEVPNSFAGVPGLEPRLAEPESAGLPITPYPKWLRCLNVPSDLENSTDFPTKSEK